jgi:LysR family transcriptional regulator, nitrogen assimilation regulatory protein
MRSIGRSARIRTELESIVGLKQFTQQGDDYTILPRGEIEEELASGRLAKMRVTNPTIHRTLFIAWSNERPFTPQMRAVQELAKRESARIIQQGTWATRFLG